jgi:DNA-binding LacI/PurR family transcriptional regulator
VIVESHRLDDQARDVLQKAGTRAILAADAIVADQQAQGKIGQAGTVAAAHLLATGHRWLGAVVPHDPTIRWLGLRRLTGVAQVAQAHGVPVERIDLALDRQEALVLAHSWRTQPHPTGVFAYNDEYAMLLLSALHKAGVAIPGDVAVIGCDNLPLCDFLIPPLTSIAVHPEVSGRALADRFHAMILGLPLPPAEPAEPTLIVRESA